MNRYFGVVRYKGTAYSGFQRQSNRISVQGELERVLSFLLGEDIAIAGAGRTDAGVHANGQTFTFDSPKPLKESFLGKANRLLPKDIEILSLCPCDPSFHARHSSCGKKYVYRLLPLGRKPFEVDTLAQIQRTDFDASLFIKAIVVYAGKHNFQNFTSKSEDVDGFIRNITVAKAESRGDEILVTFEGNGFMTYQVRLMVGAAIKVAIRQLTIEDLIASLEAKQRKVLTYKAPAEGLYLEEVYYETKPGI